MLCLRCLDSGVTRREETLACARVENNRLHLSMRLHLHLHLHLQLQAHCTLLLLRAVALYCNLVVLGGSVLCGLVFLYCWYRLGQSFVFYCCFSGLGNRLICFVSCTCVFVSL